MAYFFGKGARTPVLEEFLKRQQSVSQPSALPLTQPQPAPLMPAATPLATPVATPAATPVVPEPATTQGSYIDELMSAVFGSEFENIRGLGGRTRESMFDFLAREGLLGTGAARDIAQETAWQTEKGITDLTRQMMQWREAEEQEAFGQLLQYLFGIGSMWS